MIDQSAKPEVVLAEHKDRLSFVKPDINAAAEWVADVLRDRIVRGELGSGARIVERKLSQELKVSRTPVREALKLLRADGLVDISRHRGAQVRIYTAAEARDLFDTIAALESLAAQRLAKRLTPDILDRLENLHLQMTAIFHAGLLERYFETNSAIHDLVIAECGNPVLAKVHCKLILRAKRGRFLAITNERRWAQAMDEHEELMTALRECNAIAAGEIWGRHLRHTGDTVEAMLAKLEAGSS